jgi:hypothetical protein
MTRSFLAVLAWISATSYGCAGAARPATSPQNPPGSSSTGIERAAPAGEAPTPEGITGWFCPMHPDVTSESAGKCKKCGMTLLAGDPFETREYILDFETSPPVVKAGEPFSMNFTIQHPRTGTLIKDFAIVHDKPYHLFVVSQDMTSFQHIHPTVQPDGSWSVDVTLPKPGYYRVLSDFLPAGGSPQFLGRSLVTSDFDGDLLSQSAHLQADEALRKTVDGITAEVKLDPPKLIAGRNGHLAFTLTDANTGEGLTDIQPYLGAFGHTLVLSEDLADYVHSHPTDDPESDISRGSGGPRISFEGYLPRAGRYRAWTQFLRNGQLTTFTFTFTVWSLEDAVR